MYHFFREEILGVLTLWIPGPKTDPQRESNNETTSHRISKLYRSEEPESDGRASTT